MYELLFVKQTECHSKNVRQHMRALPTRYTTIFPLAVQSGGCSGHEGKPKFYVRSLFTYVVGEGPQCDRQGKGLTKPFNLTLAVEFHASDLCSLSQVKRMGISEKVVLRSP